MLLQGAASLIAWDHPERGLRLPDGMVAGVTDILVQARVDLQYASMCFACWDRQHQCTVGGLVAWGDSVFCPPCNKVLHGIMGSMFDAELAVQLQKQAIVTGVCWTRHRGLEKWSMGPNRR